MTVNDWLISNDTVAASNRLSKHYEAPARWSRFALIGIMFVLPFAVSFARFHPALTSIASAAIFVATTLAFAALATPPRQGIELSNAEHAGLQRVWVTSVIGYGVYTVLAVMFAGPMASRIGVLVLSLLNLWSFLIAFNFSYAMNLKFKAENKC